MPQRNNSQGNENHILEPQIVKFSIKKLVVILGLSNIILTVLSIAGQLLKYSTNYEEAFGLIPLFYMGKAISIPTIFTVLVVFIITIILLIITIAKFYWKDKFRRHWLGLTYFFFFFTLDKGSALHTYFFKQFRGFMRNFYPTFPNQKWVTTIIFIAIIVIYFYPKFIIALPNKTKILSLFSLSLYYLGFLFINRFAFDYQVIYNTKTLVYSIYITIGKMLENLGLILCIYALFNYLKTFTSEITLEYCVTENV